MKFSQKFLLLGRQNSSPEVILFAHILFGAAIGAQINNPYLAILLAFFGHYFLDAFPHIEYSIKDIVNKQWKAALPDFLKVSLDFWLAFLIIFIFSKNQPIIYVCGFIAVIPDAFTVISSVYKNKILKMHDFIHTKYIHYLTKQKKFPVFWRIMTQVTVIIISIILLR